MVESKRVHAFRDDALGTHDGVALAQLVKSGDVSPRELVEAAIERVERVNPTLNAVELAAYEQALAAASRTQLDTAFPGVPSFIKDNTDLAGLPTRHGSRATTPLPAKKEGAFASQFMAQGFAILGKTRLPEFGFNCTTEYEHDEPVRNPWHTDYSCGGSSGGSAALVAAGVVPLAHANDGGGSIRIPAACCGLLGLKSTRGRLVTGEMARTLPINIVSEGVVSRSVRDTAHFFAAAERYWRNKKLPPVGLVEGPGHRRLRIGMIVDSITGPSCTQTRQTVEQIGALLAGLGHHVEPIGLPVGEDFVDDFADYWGFLAFMASRFGRLGLGRGFDASQLDSLSKGLARRFQRRMYRTPLVLYRLQRSWQKHAHSLRELDLILTPVLGHVTPRLGAMSPDQPFDELFIRLMRYVSFTPVNNANGSPAISVPAGTSQKEGLPIAVQLTAKHGQERTLLEIAYEIEAEKPWLRIDQVI